MGAGTAGLHGRDRRRLLADPAIDALAVYYVDVYDGDAGRRARCDLGGGRRGRPSRWWPRVVRSDGRRRPRSRTGVPNFLFPESCAAVLAHAAERREWLSRPLGEAPDYDDLDRRGRARDRRRRSLSARRPEAGWPRWRGRGAAEHARDPGRGVVSLRATSSARSRSRPSSTTRWRSRPTLRRLRRRATSTRCCGASRTRRRSGRAGASSSGACRRPGSSWTGAIVQPLFLPGGADVLVGAVADPDLGPVLAVGPRRPPRRDRRHRGVPAAADHRRGRRRADRRLRERRRRARRPARQPAARPRGAARADPALRAAAAGRPGCRRGRPQPDPLHGSRDACVLDTRLRIEHRAPIERVKTW